MLGIQVQILMNVWQEPHKLGCLPRPWYLIFYPYVHDLITGCNSLLFVFSDGRCILDLAHTGQALCLCATYPARGEHASLYSLGEVSDS